MTFSEPPVGLSEEIARTEAFAREQLGDVRTFSLDSPASRAPKIAWLHQHGAASTYFSYHLFHSSFRDSNVLPSRSP